MNDGTMQYVSKVVSIAPAVTIYVFVLSVAHEEIFFIHLKQNFLTYYVASDFLTLAVPYILPSSIFGLLYFLSMRSDFRNSLSSTPQPYRMPFLIKLLGLFGLMITVAAPFSNILAPLISAAIVSLVLFVTLMFANSLKANLETWIILTSGGMMLANVCAGAYSEADNLRDAKPTPYSQAILDKPPVPGESYRAVRMIANGVLVVDSQNRMILVQRDAVQYLFGQP